MDSNSMAGAAGAIRAVARRDVREIDEVMEACMN
jgi:hypothetical protein